MRAVSIHMLYVDAPSQERYGTMGDAREGLSDREEELHEHKQIVRGPDQDLGWQWSGGDRLSRCGE